MKTRIAGANMPGPPVTMKLIIGFSFTLWSFCNNLFLFDTLFRETILPFMGDKFFSHRPESKISFYKQLNSFSK